MVVMHKIYGVSGESLKTASRATFYRNRVYVRCHIACCTLKLCIIWIDFMLSILCTACINQSFVCQWSCPWCHMQVRAVSICDKSSSLPRYERRRAQTCFQDCCIIAKLMYASPAWWEFASAVDKKRIEAFVQRGVRLGLYLANDPMPTELATDSDNNLFGSVLYNCRHVLKQLLPDKTDHQYNLRHRRHNLSLSVKHDDRNFVTRQLFKDAY